MLELSVNPLSAHDIYSLLNTGNLLQYFQMQLSQKRKIFAAFFFFVISKVRYLLIPVQAFEVEKISLGHMRNLRTL